VTSESPAGSAVYANGHLIDLKLWGGSVSTRSALHVRMYANVQCLGMSKHARKRPVASSPDFLRGSHYSI
jgi:hypothetical protein